MFALNCKVEEGEEVAFHLETRNFFRSPLKQIGNSLFEIRSHYINNDTISVVPSECCSHLAEVRDTLLNHLDEDSFLYKNNIVSGTSIDQSGGIRPSLVVLMESLSLAMDIEIPRRPNDVLCDILLTVCGQPVIVITVVNGYQYSKGVAVYNTSVASGVTSNLRNFMDDNINIVFGVICMNDLEEYNMFKSSLEKLAKESSKFVTASSLTTSPSKYEKIVTAFWAGVAQTRSVISKDGRMDTDYLRFLTKDQCVILLENINKKDVTVEYLTGTGATTLMLEVCRRLARLEDTLLVCSSPEEKDRLRSVYPHVTAADALTMTDLSQYTNIVDETGTVAGPVSGKLWSFTSVETKAEQLQHRVELLEKEKANTEKMVLLLSSDDRQNKMKHLLWEIETLKLFDINYQGLVSAYHLPESVTLEFLSAKQIPTGEGSGDQRLEVEEYARYLLEQLKQGLHGRYDLFPLVAGMMKQLKSPIHCLQAKIEILQLGAQPVRFKTLKTIMEKVKRPISYLQAKFKTLKLATSSRTEVGHRTKQKQANVFWEPGPGSMKDGAATDREDTTVISRSPNIMTEQESPNIKTEEKPFSKGAQPVLGQHMVDSEKVAELEKRFKSLKMETDQQQAELNQLSAADSLTEWQYNMDCLYQELVTLHIRGLITDVIGEHIIPVTLQNQKTLATASADDGRTPDSSGRKLSYVHQLITYQHGQLTKRKLMDTVRHIMTADQEKLSRLQAQTDHLERVFGSPMHIVGEVETDRSCTVSCPAMTLSEKRVHRELAVSAEELTNRLTSGDDHHPDQFKTYWGTCCAPITLPDSPWTPTVPRYWETNSRLQGKERGLWPYLLEMGLTEQEDLDRYYRVSGQGRSGWCVSVVDCPTHSGSLCINVWEKGRQVGRCLSTTPSPTPGTEVEFTLGTVLDVGRGRLAFIDINKEKVLHRFDVTFRQPVYPVFGVLPLPNRYDITMRLYSGREISFTDSKRKLIAKALSSDYSC